MKTFNAFFNGQTENEINRFKNFALSNSAMTAVRGGDGGPTTDIWIPDDDESAK